MIEQPDDEKPQPVIEIGMPSQAPPSATCSCMANSDTSGPHHEAGCPKWAPLHALCPNCGDGSGWHHVCLGAQWVWVACADCNNDATKPHPDLCESCGETPAFCVCEASHV